MDPAPSPARAARDPGRAPGRPGTRAARRAPPAGRRNATRPAARSSRVPRKSVVDGLLEAGAGGEARHLRGGDLDRLPGPRVDSLARAALGHVELAEARERHIAPTLERVLDDAQDRVNSVR